MLNFNNHLHFKLISFLFILIPFALLTGPFLPDLFLSIVALYFLIVSLKYKLFSYYKNIFVYLFSAFYAYLLIRGIFSEYPYDSLLNYNGPIFYFRYLFFVLALKFLMDNAPVIIRKFTLSLLIVILFACIDGLYQWIFGANLFGFVSPSIRVTGVFGDEEILGHFLSHVTPLLIFLLTFLYGFKNKKIFLLIFILMISEITIFISNDRAGFLKIFQFTILLVMLSQNFKIYRLISFIVSLIIIATLIKFAPDSAERFQHTVRDVSSTTVPYMPWAPSHETHFAVALDMFLDNPIFGQGPQHFKILCQIIPEYQSACTSHPHNYYFQTLGELGIIGTLFLVISFLYTASILLKHFVALWITKNSKNLLEDHYLFLICFIFLILWPLIPNQSFYNNWLNVMIYIPVGFAIYLKSKS
tara:strand:- start:79 stop:1323 length:1245 start_codon:yes stop_codon:yes gene_type:complete